MTFRLAYRNTINDGAYAIEAVPAQMVTDCVVSTIGKHLDDPEARGDDRVIELAVATLERIAILITGGFND